MVRLDSLTERITANYTEGGELQFVHPGEVTYLWGYTNNIMDLARFMNQFKISQTDPEQ